MSDTPPVVIRPPQEPDDDEPPPYQVGAYTALDFLVDRANIEDAVYRLMSAKRPADMRNLFAHQVIFQLDTAGGGLRRVKLGGPDFEEHCVPQVAAYNEKYLTSLTNLRIALPRPSDNQLVPMKTSVNANFRSVYRESSEPKEATGEIIFTLIKIRDPDTGMNPWRISGYIMSEQYRLIRNMFGNLHGPLIKADRVPELMRKARQGQTEMVYIR